MTAKCQSHETLDGAEYGRRYLVGIRQDAGRAAAPDQGPAHRQGDPRGQHVPAGVRVALFFRDLG